MLAELQNCKSIYDLAVLLEIPAKTLAYLIYKLPDEKKYTETCLSKKNGGTRIIKVPEQRLKELQRRLSDVLYMSIQDLEDKHGKRRRSFGFEKGLSIYENALCHVNKRWVFNLDLSEFFPSINFGRVIGYFKNNGDFKLNPRIATIIAQIACHDNQLPQGAPSSPIISNLICGSLDFRLSKIAHRARCNYSRYVDDITFSTNLATFPELIASEVSSPQGWAISDELESRIKSSGFAINDSKTRMSFRRSRQVVTGLVVNKKPAVKREIYKNTRAAIHNMIRGKQWHAPRFCEPFRLNCEDQEPDADPFAVLEGRMSFIYQIENRSDNRKDNAKFFNPSSIAKTYADLLFFKYFTGDKRPMILTEGLSDIIYIKAALKNLGPVAGLSELDIDGNLKLMFDFYNFSASSSRLIGLSGGSGNLSLFLDRLHSFQRRLSTNVTRRPLIILLDNDKGLTGLDTKVKDKFGTDISIGNDETYYRIAPKTAIVKTPHRAKTNHKSCVEDFLDPRALRIDLDGRTFSSKDKFDLAKHYGKVTLAKEIYNDYNNYSFTKFKAILDRLDEAMLVS